MTQPLIGILTCRKGNSFAESDYFRRMIRHGRQCGAVVFLFTPSDVYPDKRVIRGYVPGAGRSWQSRLFAWPDLVIDQYRYYPVKKHAAYPAFRRQPLFPYVNNRFANKWKVYQLLASDERINKWLPEGRGYAREQVEEMLKRYGTIYLKPMTGTGGRSILRIEQKGKSRYMLTGRTKRCAQVELEITDREEMLAFLDRWICDQKRGKEHFFLQQGLDLDLIPDRTVDMRVLIQKDGYGKWKVTGMGVRIGERNSSTSNLHAGGKAQSAARFLTSAFGREQAGEMMREAALLAHRVVRILEEHFGRMMEFGIDLGIDVAGRIWLIECNPKPGRKIFLQMNKPDLYQLAVTRPLEYALYLLRQQENETAAEVLPLTPSASKWTAAKPPSG